MGRPKGVKDFEQGTATVPDPEVSSLGQAMLACNEAERRFAIAAVMYPLAKDWQIAKAAGYSDRSQGALRVTAHRLFHSDRVLAAIRECADKEVRSGGMLAIATIKKIVRNDGHRDQFKAAQWLAGMNGQVVAQTFNVNQNVTDNSGKALLERIERAAAVLGVDAAQLLGLMPMKVVSHDEPQS